MSEAAITVSLRLPDKALSPNGRAHWRTKAKATKAYRSLAHALALEALRGTAPPQWDKATMQATFYFPNSRRQCRPDSDNSIASLKAAIDGIADAGIVGNDRNLIPLPPVILCDPENPRVEITITETP